MTEEKSLAEVQNTQATPQQEVETVDVNSKTTSDGVGVKLNLNSKTFVPTAPAASSSLAGIGVGLAPSGLNSTAAADGTFKLYDDDEESKSKGRERLVSGDAKEFVP